MARPQARLRVICEPDEVDGRARALQRAKGEEFGGDEAIRACGAFPFTPPPGTAARMVEVR